MGRASTLTLVVLTLSIAVISTFGEFAPGQLGHRFHEELGMPISLVGVLTSIVFAASGVGSIPAGWIADRVSPRILSPIQLVIAAVAFGSFAFVHTQAGLIATSIAIGLGMSFMNPIANRIITLYAPRSAFARIMGWKSVGPQLGGVFAGLMLGGVTGIFDWRPVVLTLAILMALPAIWAGVVLHRSSEYTAPVEVAEGGEGDSGSVEDDDPAPEKTRPIVWWLLPYLVFSAGVVGSIGAYLPLYATLEIGLSTAVGGASVSIIAAVSVVMRFVWIRFLNRRNAVPLLVLGGVLTMLSSLVLVIAPLFGPWVFWLGVVLVGACAMGATPIPQIVLLQNANPARIGMVSAWSTLASMVGFTAQPWLLSILLERVGFSAAWLAVTFCGLGAALTITLYALVQRRRMTR